MELIAEEIKEAIEYFREKGKLTDDDNDEFIEDQLMDMRVNTQEEFGKMR